MTDQPHATPEPANCGFSDWIDTLQEKVIQDEFGYEPGEFTVYPSEWRSLFDEGMTPREAWQRALDDFAKERANRDREQAENWARIQLADAAIRSPNRESR